MLQFVLRWEENGVKKRKEYSDEATAKKARKWLEERGITDVDIAVRPMPKPNHFPVGVKK